MVFVCARRVHGDRDHGKPSQTHQTQRVCVCAGGQRTRRTGGNGTELKWSRRWSESRGVNSTP